MHLRRTWPLLRAAACLAMSLGVSAPAMAENYGLGPTTPSAAVSDRDVRVRRQGSAFSVEVVMQAPVPPAVAWEVLTDFERMPRYQKDLKSSEVLERAPERMLVRQQGLARIGPFSRAFESTREMTLTPQRSIRARQVSGSTLKQMSSLMTLEPAAGGTRLTYHANMEPESELPPLFGPAFVQHEMAQQFSATIREMVRRQAAAGKP